MNDDQPPSSPSCPPPSSSNEKHTQDPSLLEPHRYINSVPGKDVRGKLIDCFQQWLNVDTSSSQSPTILEDIKLIVADLHNASLLVDDIEDNSKLRRGIPVAHSIFGVPSVINCANYVYFLALERCHALGNAKAMDVFVKEMLNLHRGQGYDIMWRDHGICPTEDKYCAMVTDKTGGLFRLAVGLMQAFATTNKQTDFSPLLNQLALYFQIRDDLINLADSDYHNLKSFCEDLTEGKFSFPIIHCINNAKDPYDTKLKSILKQRTDDVELKRYARGLMIRSGSLAYTREKCVELKKAVVELIEGLGGNPMLLKLIERLDVQIEGMEEVVSPDGANIDMI